MIATLHLCAPEGEVLRQQLSNMLNMLKEDNRYVINAMLHSGLDVPDTVVEAGLEYIPSRHEKASNGEPVQVYYGMRAMFESGTFSCAEAVGYEAAVLEEKYGIPTEGVSVAFDGGDHHAIFVTPDGEVDPTENYLRYWESQMGLGTLPPKKINRRVVTDTSLGAVCRIVDGRVDCDVENKGSCVDADRSVWRSSDKELNGRAARIEEVFQGQDSRKRWARLHSGIFVPVCGGV